MRPPSRPPSTLMLYSNLVPYHHLQFRPSYTCLPMWIVLRRRSNPSSHPGFNSSLQCLPRLSTENFSPSSIRRFLLELYSYRCVRSSPRLVPRLTHASFLPRFLSYPDPDPEILRIRVAPWSRLGLTFISFRQAHTRCSDSFYTTEWNGMESRHGAYTRQEYSTEFTSYIQPPYFGSILKPARTRAGNSLQLCAITNRLHLRHGVCICICICTSALARAMSLPRYIHVPAHSPCSPRLFSPILRIFQLLLPASRFQLPPSSDPSSPS
ncbi:hypothetical protein C8R45DRAFT_476480 [Mycena sanguinolenta]|nr:hypothetical protein C8R45DRAFT_476480 [Mycena sanguinolenta]